MNANKTPVIKAPMIKAKHQRLVLVIIALVAILGAGVLATWALRNQASYFYVPNEIAANPPQPDRAVRLGGMVENGSIRTEADGVTIAFVVGDGKARVPVRFKGIVPSCADVCVGCANVGQVCGGGGEGVSCHERLLKIKAAFSAR